MTHPTQSDSASAGFTILELAVVLVLVGLSAGLLIPPLVNWSSKSRVHSAAAEVVGTLRLARTYAMRHGVPVAVKFDTSSRVGAVFFALFKDEDGDGVRNVDIERGVDRRLTHWRRLSTFGPRVGFGFPPDMRPRDPGSPTHRLDRLDDPIRFNRSDLASFGPLGTSTPGSLYISDGKHLMVVRVLGLTGRVRVLQWDQPRDRWR